jgi:hypothetical protein
VGIVSDDKFEDFLQREAKAYNAPPSATPRDEMWQAVAAARAARRGGTPLPSRKPRLRYTPWIGMAATLLIGVGIGRFALQRDALPVAPETITAVTTPATTEPPVRDSVSERETPPDAAPVPRRLPAQRRAPVQLASAAGSDADQIEMATSPEQVASREHMQRAEALITVVAATPADAMMDSLTGRWAREMLTNTRLLLDSPAGDDVARRRLLEDLETLLVQLVQRSGGAVDERFLIDRTLERTQLLTRLRTSAAGI